MRKWTYELIVIAVVICVGLGIWWFVATKDQRAAEAQFKQLVKIANRQAVEIAVIRQAAELEQLKRTLAKNQRLQQPIPQPPLAIPQPPVVADPKDVDTTKLNIP